MPVTHQRILVQHNVTNASLITILVNSAINVRQRIVQEEMPVKTAINVRVVIMYAMVVITVMAVVILLVMVAVILVIVVIPVKVTTLLVARGQAVVGAILV